MQPAFLALIMITAHVSVTVDGRPKPQHHHHHHHHHQSHSASRAAADLPAASEPNRSGKKGLLVLLPVRSAAGHLVSVSDLRRTRFLCMDLLAELYQSRQDGSDRLFQRAWSDVADHHDALRSAAGYWLLRLGGRDLQAVHLQPSEARRRRRSEEVNPSDPLRSEANPPHPAKDADPPEQEQTGSVSKETITSVDDPLKVLRPNGHGSPVKTNIAERAEHE